MRRSIPFAFYSLGQAVVVPLALKAAINIFMSIVFFPKSVNSQFVERLVAVLGPIADACGDQVKLLQTSPLDTPSSAEDGSEPSKEAKDGFDFDFVTKKLTAAEGGLLPLSMASRLLTRENLIRHGQRRRSQGFGALDKVTHCASRWLGVLLQFHQGRHPLGTFPKNASSVSSSNACRHSRHEPSYLDRSFSRSIRVRPCAAAQPSLITTCQWSSGSGTASSSSSSSALPATFTPAFAGLDSAHSFRLSHTTCTPARRISYACSSIWHIDAPSRVSSAW